MDLGNLEMLILAHGLKSGYKIGHSRPTPSRKEKELVRKRRKAVKAARRQSR